ncbi:substrate-binding domain-containing protein [Pseudobacteroides cellulosolvens]|uniref:PBP domain containing protein n=1 Tax=Pseudobacteroides cellulosolvens ATCC 35603 = DSM 2933 TaxID=398512 RepID=A0A0L6JKZ6_9FIRM|nr:phosphate ABC transporter substrate-binding/OmpA family protein [Pseudobacteroides cellulosolvens]KNY26388.1 PBP domain containing protein [Pseudobacteroides cellulosolvens ATCC 35603 = DSM 2933]
MNISKKCLNPMCNKYEDASKKNYKSCNDCAYLFKPGITGLLDNIRKIGISVLLISVLVITGFAVSKAVFQNHNNETSSSSAANEISSPTEETNPKIPGTSLDNSETVLRIHGSNTIGTKLMPKLVEGYLEKKGAIQIKTTEGSNPQEKKVEFKWSNQDEKTYDIEIYSHGSGTAFKEFELAACDIGMTSRKINEKEISKLKAIGLGDLSTVKSEFIIALDGISIIVNKNNPINHLSVEQISDIFSGKITNWSQLGGKDGKIRVFTRDENSGTYDTFKNLILNNKALLSAAVWIESTKDLCTEVSKDINSIGFTSFSYTGDTKPLSISQGTADPVFPNTFNIATEEYYLSKRIYLYCPENIQNPYATELINYITDDEGQNIIKDCGFATIDIQVDENFKPFTKPTFKNQKAQQKYNQIVSNAQGRLSVNFLFKNGSSELDNKSIKDLEKVINFLFRNKYINSEILLVGYSDNKGDYNMNIKLSNQRALRVKELILNQFSALGGRVDVLGMGPEMPIASNKTSGGMDRNRRVEVYIMKNIN